MQEEKLSMRNNDMTSKPKFIKAQIKLMIEAEEKRMQLVSIAIGYHVSKNIYNSFCFALNTSRVIKHDHTILYMRDIS